MPIRTTYSGRVQLATLATRHGIATSFASRENVEAGGLMSYGTNIDEAFRHNGVYVGRILNGEKPANLPVMQSTKFELVVNADNCRTSSSGISPSRLNALQR
jgi:putative tryptophan/tyrosine transport system substrate-binding protein